jgi:hypothetical protein
LSHPSGWRETILSRAPAALFALFLVLGLAMAVVWAFRGYVVFNYTEGVVLGSMAGFQASGTPGLYPTSWNAAPLVLTLYPPVFFWVANAVSSILGLAELLTAARLVSLFATLGVGWSLMRIRSATGASWTWFLLLCGSAFVLPGVVRQLGAAQVDMLAASLTCLGVAFALKAENADDPIWVPLGCFALAIFTKHTYVAAPAALFVYRAVSGYRWRALVEAVGFGGFIVSGFLLLNAWTQGGFLAHVLVAAADSGATINMLRVIGDSAPEVWVPLAALVLVGAHGRLKLGLAELWLSIAAIIHFGAMWKTGASVNYFLEPALALVVVGLVSSRNCPWVMADSEPKQRLAVALLFVVVLATASRASDVVRDARLAYGAVPIRMAAFEPDYPLVEVDFFPSVLRHGRRPYLNDPFAFGGLAESGSWDASGLAGDLAARRVPFALTTIDIRPPLPDGARTEDQLFSYFWRMPAVRDGLLTGYAVTSDGLLNVWLPAAGTD